MTDPSMMAKHLNYAPISDDSDQFRAYKDFVRNFNIENWLDSDKISEALGFQQMDTEHFNLAIAIATSKSASKVPPVKKKRVKA